jgi:hypothetical protein
VNTNPEIAAVVAQVLRTLDDMLGDTDPSIPDDFTEDDIRSTYPLFWCYQQLVGLRLESAKGEVQGVGLSEGERLKPALDFVVEFATGDDAELRARARQVLSTIKPASKPPSDPPRVPGHRPYA